MVNYYIVYYYPLWNEIITYIIEIKITAQKFANHFLTFWKLTASLQMLLVLVETFKLSRNSFEQHNVMQMHFSMLTFLMRKLNQDKLCIKIVV